MELHYVVYLLGSSSSLLISAASAAAAAAAAASAASTVNLNCRRGDVMERSEEEEERGKKKKDREVLESDWMVGGPGKAISGLLFFLSWQIRQIKPFFFFFSIIPMCSCACTFIKNLSQVFPLWYMSWY